ncbi:MAG: CopD family protein [Deltaproteobacteria bacterium]|nr:CopD family protein [Deltaproteobacteria bacterium]
MPKKTEGTVEFTCETGQSCIYCHESPEGGDTLTAKGEAFVAADYIFDESVSAPGWPISLRLISGFLHVLASVIWFGAIFYIHIFIKPTSLTGGLPRNERILGWVCIAIVGVTGTILTFLRVRSIEEFWTTTFGIVWLVKIFFFIIMVLIAAVATTRLNRRMREAQRSAKKGSLTEYDGKEGRPAYFVFNNELFDASESKMWRNGVHMGRHYAGTDLSSAMDDAPHGNEVFERIKKIGPSSFQDVSKKTPAATAFIFMAYFILFCMFMVIFCVAYWNWGPSIMTD